jgi:hypothetical protein
MLIVLISVMAFRVEEAVAADKAKSSFHIMGDIESVEYD